MLKTHNCEVALYAAGGTQGDGPGEENMHNTAGKRPIRGKTADISQKYFSREMTPKFVIKLIKAPFGARNVCLL